MIRRRQKDHLLLSSRVFADGAPKVLLHIASVVGRATQKDLAAAVVSGTVAEVLLSYNFAELIVCLF